MLRQRRFGLLRNATACLVTIDVRKRTHFKLSTPHDVEMTNL